MVERQEILELVIQVIGTLEYRFSSDFACLGIRLAICNCRCSTS